MPLTWHPFYCQLQGHGIKLLTSRQLACDWTSSMVGGPGPHRTWGGVLEKSQVKQIEPKSEVLT